VSMVPNAACPASAAARTAGTFSSIHRSLGPEKYVASGRPVLSRKRSWPPSLASASHRSLVRVSCQTIALYSG
jgi:hypothetical protein